MSASAALLIEDRLSAQPYDVRLLPDEERDRLIISSVQVDGEWVILSQYGEHRWNLTGGTSNAPKNERVIDFSRVPSVFRPVLKEVLYRYLRRGRIGADRPKTSTMFKTLTHLLPFLRYLDALNITHLGAVTPMVCATFVAASKAKRQTSRRGKPLSAGTLENMFGAVEMLHELSQFTRTPMPSHPWPESSAKHQAGLTGSNLSSKTPLIPDDVFTTLFQAAFDVVKRGDELLGLRDSLDALDSTLKGRDFRTIKDAKNRHLTAHGWEGGIRDFTAAMTELRTACYIVVASLSGCRNHELAYVQTGACYRTGDDEGEVYWWMRSRSDKTGAGETEWMVPDAAVEALRVMDRWAVSFQKKLADEIAQRRAANPQDPEIAEAQRHERAVFLGMNKNQGNQVRTLSNHGWCMALKDFAKRRNLDWNLATHQFRRKFANYAARSRFGDLRYLREHFKHWSQDMTNDSYALNGSQEIELYGEIQTELDSLKLGLAEQWLNPAEPLAGGYGKNLVEWRSREDTIALFKSRAAMVKSVAESHAIRSNGHAWCTADDHRCIGNTFEKTRCSGCDNAVIGRFHARLYQRLYDDLEEVAKCDDIGPGGQARVQRDLERCSDVLRSLGHDPKAQAA
jgi:integrase